MSHYGIPVDRNCGSYRPGHRLHWIHAQKATEKHQPLIGVSITFVDSGCVDIDGEDLTLKLWTHEPLDCTKCGTVRAGVTKLDPLRRRAPRQIHDIGRLLTKWSPPPPATQPRRSSCGRCWTSAMVLATFSPV